MTNLTRTQVDKFKIENSVSFEEIEKGNFKIWTMEEIFEFLPKLNLDIRKKELFLNGVMLSYKLEDGIYNIYSEEKYIGIGIIKNNLLKRDIIE